MILGDSTAYNGVLEYDYKTAALIVPNEIELTIRGRMSVTSSALTAWAFKRGLKPIGDWGDWIVTLSVFLFALSTMISWSYYGDRCVVYLLGYRYVIVYRVIYVAFVFIGANMALDIVWRYGDVALGLMTVPNLIAVVMLAPKTVAATKEYLGRMAAAK